MIAVGAIAFDITLKKIKEQEQDKLLLGKSRRSIIYKSKFALSINIIMSFTKSKKH